MELIDNQDIETDRQWNCQRQMCSLIPLRVRAMKSLLITGSAEWTPTHLPPQDESLLLVDFLRYEQFGIHVSCGHAGFGGKKKKQTNQKPEGAELGISSTH